MKNIDNSDGIISVDAFSTSWGKKFSVEQMIIIDTSTGSFNVVDIDFKKEFGDDIR